MSKPTREVTNCEHCDGIIELCSPPLERAYKIGQIHIERGDVLLNVESPSLHAASLNGYYCTPGCLAARIEVVRSTK